MPLDAPFFFAHGCGVTHVLHADLLFRMLLRCGDLILSP